MSRTTVRTPRRAATRALAAVLCAVLGLGAPVWAGASSGAETPVVESITARGYRVRVPFGVPSVVRAELFGYDLAEIDLPDAVPAPAAPGAPPLPARTIYLRVPPAGRVTVTGAPGSWRSLGTLRPAPLAHLLSDPVARRRWSAGDLAAALSSDAYRARTASPRGVEMNVAGPMTAGGECVLAVTLRPVTWDPATGEARALESAVLDVRFETPVEPIDRAGTRRGSLEPENAVGPRYETAVAAGVDSRIERGPTRTALPGFGPLRVDPSRPWVQLGVLRPGLYQVNAADLSAAGVSPASIDPATFRLFRATPGDLPESVDVDLGPDSLRECAIEVTGAGDGSFDPADRLYFLATGATGFGYDLAQGGGSEYQETEHADLETLWLTWGSGPTPTAPRRISLRDGSPVSATSPITELPHRVHYEENRLPNFNLLEPGLRWERWFNRLLAQGSRVSFPLQIPGAVPGGPAEVRVRMWGLGNSVGAGVPDHVVRLYWNRALVDTAGWELNEHQDLVASGLTTGTRDTLDIQVPVLVDPGPFPERFDRSYLAWFEVRYRRRLQATNDTLWFAADSLPPGPARFVISGVTDSSAAWLLDRTDPEGPVRLVGGTWSGSSPSLTLTIEDNLGPSTRRYALVSTARATRPATVSRYAPASSPHVLNDLLDPSNGADYLIVAPPAFLAAAESLAAFRSQRLQGVAAPRVRIATTDRVFAQLASGRPSPVAIRNLVLYAWNHWVEPDPSYLCLLGDATYDPKNYLGIGAPDLVPTYGHYYDNTLLHQYTSDDFYTLLEGPGDLLVDLTTGRLPAGSAAEAIALVTGKPRVYESTAEFDVWRARAILAADDAVQREVDDPLKNAHVSQMERKDGLHIPFPVERAKVYLNDFAFADTTRQSKPAAREEFIAQINRGSWLTEYIGHGNEDVLADEQLFRSSDAPRLTNATRPSIFGYWSCTVGKFDDPASEGLGERLLALPGGGAVASLAATDGAFGSASTPLNDSFVDALFPLAPRVDSLRTAGLALALAKNTHAGPTNHSARKYTFLGDPAIVPPLPRGAGVWEKGPLDSVLRGDVVLFRGRALMPDATTDSVSSGEADLLIQGPPIVRTQIHPSSPLTPPQDVARQTYRVPGPTIFRGRVPLDRGAFEVRFVVPTDGRLAGPGARLRALLSSAGGEGVGLATDSIRIASLMSPRVDATPPTIQVRYPAGSDSTLRPGDPLTIALEDSSGIDLTRLDNAHTIFVIVDDKGTPYEITPQFAYDPGSYTSGTVPFTIPSLADGAHRLEIHASDNFRNIAVLTVAIEVAGGAASGSPVVLDQVFNYPNPFPRETYLHARLNQPARLRIRILTVAGRRVREIELDGKAGENYIPWDGRDSVGENVAIGVYLFHVTAESLSGGRATAVGRALRTQ